MEPEAPLVDPLLGLHVTVRKIHPFQAHKAYICPGCSHEIPPKTGHFVVVPDEAADLRRHWHEPCWTRALRIEKGAKRR